MTTKELANLLHGREYGSEITKEEADMAKEAGLVVVFGASDDLMDFCGAWHDAIDCNDGGKVYVDGDGVCYSDGDDSDCPYVKEEVAKCKVIEAVWCAPDSPDWTYKTDIPHETFDIMEDGEVYCRGIVFRAMDAAQVKTAHWITHGDYERYECSRCGEDSAYSRARNPWRTTYCPHCGASMKG